ncbi:MAG: hypothetical protein JO307_15455 [Bryobacterales bacterium]|nr:hypothetical protein [Bryobacterales bacterium]MBV9964610.1 hypothetical protein [Alphaproteobacteria bacterium]
MHGSERKSAAQDLHWPALVSDQDLVTLDGMFAAWKRSFWRILFTAAAFALAAVAYVLLTQRGYTSTAQIMIEPPKQQYIWQTPGLLDLTVDSAQVESQVEVLRSERIANQVIDRLNLTQDPQFHASEGQTKFEQRRVALGSFLGALAARRVGQSYIVEVSFSSADPEEAARITNAIADVYIQEQLATKSDAARQAGQWMEKRLAELGRQLNAAASAVHKFKTENGIADRNDNQAPLLLDKLTELEATAEAYRKLYEALLQRLTENEQQESFPVANARIIAPATTPLFPSYPKTKLILILAVLVGGAVGLGIASIRHTRDRTLRTERQVVSGLGIPCLGAVSRLRKARGLGARSGDNPAVDSPFSEYADKLRGIKVSLQAACPEKRGACIGLISVDAFDGKTDFAIGLADLYAAAGRRTLLVDANLRDAPLSAKLAPNARAGLPDALVGPDDPEVTLDPKTGVHLLPAGSAVPIANSADLLGSPAMCALMARLRDRFEVIFVDLPPLGGTPDARLLGGALDGCVLIIQWGTTPEDALQTALRRIETAQIGIFGAVIADVAEGVPPLFGLTLSDVRRSRILGWAERLLYHPLASRWAMFRRPV